VRYAVISMSRFIDRPRSDLEPASIEPFWDNLLQRLQAIQLEVSPDAVRLVGDDDPTTPAVGVSDLPVNRRFAKLASFVRSPFIAIGIAMTMSTSCIDGFSSGSAYQDEPFLCSEALVEELDEAAAACREDGCGGVLSMQGTLESQPIQLTVELSKAAFFIHQEPISLIHLLDRVEATGSSPYFVVGLELASLGEIFALDPRMLTIDSSANRKPDHLRDDNVAMIFRLTSGGQSIGFSGATAFGELVIEKQTLSELHGTFTGRFGDENDIVEGCFRTFALESFLTREGS